MVSTCYVLVFNLKTPIIELMKPERLTAFIQENGKFETHSAEKVFHAQDFPETLFKIKKGYVKRYQVTKSEERVIELIYGPDHIFPLSQLYRKVFGIQQNQENLVYVYQAMTDIEIYRIGVDKVLDALESDTSLYIDLYYESGLRLKSNINRLASNAIKDEYKKIAHQLVCLADEFGKVTESNNKQSVKLLLPLKPVDMAEQLNISAEVAEAVMISLSRSKLLKIDGTSISIPDIHLLKDIYM